MKIQEAHEILKIDTENINETTIRKHYFKQALLYHPDKNDSIDAKDHFHKISDAYEVIMKYHGYMEDNTIIEDVESDYNDTLYSYLNVITQNEFIKEFTSKLFIKITDLLKGKCENKTLQLLESLDNDTLKKVILLLDHQRNIFYIPDTFIEKTKNLYKLKINKRKNIVIYPSLNDLFADNVYKLTENEETYFIPLWHHELIYDNQNHELCIQILPKTEKHIIIDESNNIHVYINLLLTTLWKLDYVHFSLGNHNFSFPKSNLSMESRQTVILYEKGISKINEQNIYDYSKKSNIYIHVFIKH